ncbi:hypothetical protein EON81_01160 [bacterium]|nr:MAG: hypothetical protein EON81_01160 [bacterium]
MSFALLLPFSALAGSIESGVEQRLSWLGERTLVWKGEETGYRGATAEAPGGDSKSAIPGVSFRSERVDYRRDSALRLRRRQGVLVADFEYPSLDADKGTMVDRRAVLLAGSGFTGGIRYDYVGNESRPYVTEFGNTALGGEATRNPFDFSMAWPAHDLALLSGTDPLKLYGLDWKKDSESAERTEYRASTWDSKGRPVNALFRNAWSFRLTFDKAKALPVSMECYEGPQWRSVTTVEKSRNENGVWIPTQVRRKCRSGGGRNSSGENVRTLDLKSIESSRGEPLPVPKGSPIADWRLETADSNPTPFPKEGMKPVQYRWTGSLPSLEELKRMRDGTVPQRQEPLAASVVFAPLGVLLVGGFILFRKRAA